MSTTLAKQTHVDFFQLPEETLAQLIDGEIIMSPAPIPKHQKILFEIAFQIKSFLSENNLGEVFLSPIDVYFSNSEIYQPDLIFISKNRLDIIGEKYIEAAPDLVLEVLSETNAYYDLKHKKNIYEKSGVKEYWIVDPMVSTIEVFILTDKGYQLPNGLQDSGYATSEIIANLKVDIEKVFQ